MDINERLYVEIAPMGGPRPPHPHPVDDAGFDPDLVYKVIGTHNPSETSEAYFILVNPKLEIWYIPQRHLRAHALLDSDEFFLQKPQPLSSGAAARMGSRPSYDKWTVPAGPGVRGRLRPSHMAMPGQD